MKRKYILIALSILLVLFFFALFPYLFIFSTRQFSKNSSDWANAATWFNLFISTITTILILYLTWRIHKNEEKRETENQLFLKSLERPVVICKSKKKKKKGLVEKWGVTNVGKGAALNLRINYIIREGYIGMSLSLVQCIATNKLEAIPLTIFTIKEMSPLHFPRGSGDTPTHEIILRGICDTLNAGLTLKWYSL